MPRKSYVLRLVVVLSTIAFIGCAKRTELEQRYTATPAPAASRESKLTVGFLTPRAIGAPSEGPAWITDLTLVDLDRDGLPDVVCCDAKLNRICWIRQVRPGEYVEQPVGETIAGPAHVDAVDFDGDGDLDLLIAGMGMVPPNNDKIGTIVLLENDGRQHFTKRVILDHTYRVTDVRAADFNGDGRLDLAVAQFGYLEGQMQWLENRGAGQFLPHPLLDVAGAIHCPVVDLNQDGRPDVVALVAQDWEEVWAFENRGGAELSKRILYGSTNKDYGSSGLTVGDVNHDGWPDIVYSNGDGFDYATPGSRPWHGVQWLENDRHGRFVFHRIGDCPGAYSPVIVDLDGDGDEDIVAVSGFNDWRQSDAVSLLCFENDGHGGWAPRPLAHAPTHLVVAKAGAMKPNGPVALVTGSFAFYPPTDRAARVTLWERTR